jgi:capsular exopolysaccharide synthesis family protein
MQNQDEIDLRWIFGVIRRWWWLILICTLLAGGTAYYVMSSREPTYEATTTLLVSPGQDTRTNEYNTLVAGERLALTYIEMFKSQTVLETVISKLGLHVTSEQLAKKIQANTVKDTQLIRLTAESTSAAQAALLANTIAETFTTHIQKLQAERYASTLASLQAEMDTQLSASGETQAQIDALNARKIEDAARLANLEKLLNEQRNDYRSLELDYENLKLTVSQLTNVVKVVEPAQPPGDNAAQPYQATTTLLVENEGLIQTYSEMLVGRPVLEATIAKLGLDESPDSLITKIRVEPAKDTQLIRLGVVDNDKTKAALIANTIAEFFIGNIKTLLEQSYTGRLADMRQQIADLSAQIEMTQAEIAALTTSNGQIETELVRLQTLLADQRSDYQALKDDYGQLRLAAADANEVISITEPAQAPDKTADSNALLYIGIAVLAGALLALGFAFLLEYMNDTIRTTADVNRLLNLTTLGEISQLAKGDQRPVVVSQPLSPNAEAFRMLAANLRYSSLEFPLRTLLVTSPNSQEGKSIITANLAAAMALTELRVLVVDADLRRPNIHRIFGFEQDDGLTNSLLERTMDGRLKEAEPAGLRVLTSGDSPPNPAEVLGSARMQELLVDLQHQADMVLIDCPPVLPVADTNLLAPHVDGVLLVLRANQTRSQAAVEAVESLRKVGGRIVGVVLNATPRSKKGYYYYYSNPEMKKAKSKKDKGVLINEQERSSGKE